MRNECTIIYGQIRQLQSYISVQTVMCVCILFRSILNFISPIQFFNTISVLQKDFLSTHTWHMICGAATNVYIQSVTTREWVMPSGLNNILVFLFIHLRTIFIIVLWFYSDLSGRVRSVYLFSLCAVSLLSSGFTASALVWFSDLLKCLVFHFFISLSAVFICRSSWILWLFMYQGAFRISRRVLDCKRWGISMLELEAVPHSWIS
jgi:hypothetical protein